MEFVHFVQAGDTVKADRIWLKDGKNDWLQNRKTTKKEGKEHDTGRKTGTSQENGMDFGEGITLEYVPYATLKKYSELTKDGRKHALNISNAILKRGTKVTCLKIVKKDNQIWLEIPSGFICAKYGDKVYVK